MREVEILGTKYRIKELTYGEVLEYMEKSTKTIVTPTGEVRTVVDAVNSAVTLLRLCVEVEDSGKYRSLTEDEIRRLPGRVGMRLVSECMKVNDFLVQA